MEVDPSPSSSAGFALPKIDEDSAMDSKTAKQRLTEILDLIESHVEKLRKEAGKLEEERDSLLASLDSVRNTDTMTDLSEFEREETYRLIDRITDRCLTVDIKVHTQRDKEQEEALYQVNHLIDTLVISARMDPDGTKSKCVTYMNACSSHAIGITDKKFEGALLGCTLDDQKRVKKRLQGLLNYFDKLLLSNEIETVFTQ